jgi:type IV pilus assembly protein PilA
MVTQHMRQNAAMPSLSTPTSPRGFTLIEIMVVVAVIAILASMAVPVMLGKLMRDQIVEAMPLADIAKKPVALAWSTSKSVPNDNTAAGLPEADKIVSNHVKAVRIEMGAIHIVFGNRATSALQNKTLTLRPAVVSDAPIVPVAWVCGYAAVPDKMTALGTDRTDVSKAYLPASCR